MFLDQETGGVDYTIGAAARYKVALVGGQSDDVENPPVDDKDLRAMRQQANRQ